MMKSDSLPRQGIENSKKGKISPDREKNNGYMGSI